VLASAAALRDGAPEIAYAEAGAPSTINTGVNSYVGCSRYQDTELRQAWTRADGSTFQEILGPGTPVGPTYACIASGGTNVTDWVKYGESGVTDAGGSWQTFYVCQYKATRTTTREDGIVIGSQTATSANLSYGQTCYYGVNFGGHCGYGCGTSPCANNPSAAAVANWRAELGW